MSQEDSEPIGSAAGVRTNPIRTRQDWEEMRGEAREDPGAFHGAIAKREIHWYSESDEDWLSWDDASEAWTGFDHETGGETEQSHPESHDPWDVAFDDSEAPLYEWFSGGLTNACFNEVDRHVLAGHGDETAFHFEGDRWDQSKNDGRGGPVVSEDVSRRELLVRVVTAAQVLQNLGLEKGDRIALNMPNVMEQIYYMEAAKRLGIVYTPVFGGFSDKTLSDRIARLGADVLITADGGYRNAEVVPYKEQYADPALDDYLPVEMVTRIVDATLSDLDVEDRHVEAIQAAVEDVLSGEITVERAQAMRGVGNALAEFGDLSGEEKSEIRTEIARALVDSEERLDQVVVVEHTGQEIQMRERDAWAHELEAQAREDVLESARESGFDVDTVDELFEFSDTDLARALFASSRPEPVDAEYPLFVIFTSGSTGKPKGVVHVHGGYTAGIAHTMKVSFDVVPGEDTAFVIADPGWITGQSYLVSASLSTRTTSVVLEGAPVYPDAGRFTSVIERYGVTVFKAGVTFLKGVMEDDENVSDMRAWSTDSLRVATFCAEPVSPAVQEFGMEEVCEWYINSYWATEHGGIVWTHFFGNDDFPLEPNAHTYPLPWVFGDVWVREEDVGEPTWREAETEEKGEIVITEPYPYLMRYVWGDLENWGPEQWQTDWRGNAERFQDVYWTQKDDEYAYLQGDFARTYDDESFSLHGRSDEVINVSGHRMGTEEIEGAILRDKQINPDSPVANAVVVGAEHHEKGLTPVAFVQTKPDERLTAEVENRLAGLVREEKGVVAVPEDFIEVEEFPETRSGKYMRRMLAAMLNGEDIGDTTTLKNPESIDEIRPECERWRRRQDIAAEQELLEEYRNLTVQYNTVRGADTDEQVATVIIDNPPVNALNERALDELNTVVEHLDRREDVGAVVLTGGGSSTFVAGADVEQFLEEVHEFEEALSFPHKAHEAFRKIEKLSVPVVAAVNGSALGGGNELQLAAHYSVADPSAEFGQPELNLNLLPGYGGTQRLPRLLAADRGSDGVRDALKLITNGRNVDAEEAAAMGLVDELSTDQTARARASALAREHVENGGDSGLLAAAREERLQRRAEWVEPGEFPEAVLDDAIIARNRRQCEHTSEGRRKAFERAVEAVRTGFEEGIEAGMEAEATNFAEAVVDPEGGKAGIEKFLDRESEPLPTKERYEPTPEEEQELIEEGELLPVGASFYPGVDEIPDYQYGQAVVKDDETGEADHDDPIEAEVEEVYPVEDPGPNEVLVYVLASEVNFNDIWAITGIPVSQFDAHDQDYHITGSGGSALVVDAGEEVRREGRIAIGDLVTLYSGQSDLLSPTMGLDPMYAGFSIQGYEGPNGSHQQFMIAQAPQVHPIPQDASLEQAGAYVLATGTVYRALFTTLGIEPRSTMFVEGASTGTGWEAAKIASQNDVSVTGLCSSEERAERIGSLDASAINRKAEAHADIWGPIPEDPEKWEDWKEAGREFVEAFTSQHGGERADYAVSHAGQMPFPRTFQLLGEGGQLTFYGASTGYYLTFLGKPGRSTPAEMYERADVRAGQGVLIYYGTDTGPDDMVDETGLRAIEDAREAGARVAVVAYTDEQQEFVESLGYGDAVEGTVSIESLKRREEEFRWPDTLPDLPDSQADPEAFRAAVQEFTDEVFKPLGKAVGDHLGTPKNPRGYPDVVFERADHDSLWVSMMLVKPHTGTVVYSEDMEDRRYTMYAPQVWMRQRDVLMPTADILGTHLSNAYEVEQLNEAIDADEIELTDPAVVDWEGLPEAHQAMWDNEHEASSYVVDHALPDEGLMSKEELFLAWARDAAEQEADDEAATGADQVAEPEAQD